MHNLPLKDFLIVRKKNHILPRNKFKELMSFWQIYYKSVQNILEFHLLSMIFPRQFLEQNVQVWSLSIYTIKENRNVKSKIMQLKIP